MKLSDIIDFKNGKKKPEITGNIPKYGGNGITGYTNDSNSNGKCLIIGRVGAYCGCVYREENKCWISDNAIVGYTKPENDFYYSYYLLKNMDLNSLHIGSSQPLMTQEILNNIEVKVPKYNIQQKIGQILNKIDLKIKENSETNNNLLLVA